ncbi:MAG: VanZ family protein [Rhodocyclaceae bacterium]
MVIRTGRLPAHLTVAYALLTVYACLFPFTGWRDIGTSPFVFLTLPWPRWFTWTDTIFNVLGYIPLGFVFASALRQHQRGWRAVFIVTFACGLFSFCIESAQNYLPTRVASNIDLACNTFGAFVGALMGVRWGRVFDEHGALEGWRQRRFHRGHIGELGMVLIALWWLTLLEPSNILFGNGDLRPIFNLPAPLAFSVKRYVVLEAAVVAAQMLAVGLVIRRTMREPAVGVLAVVFVIGLCVKMIATSAFVRPPVPLEWASPGALRGIAVGFALLALTWRLPNWAQHTLASVSLLCATALVNLAPENPFDWDNLSLIQQGNFLNFHGLTTVAASSWPFFALAYLTAQGALASRSAAR